MLRSTLRLAIGCFAVTALAAHAQTVGDVLSKARSAISHPRISDQAQGISVTGVCRMLGLDATYSLLLGPGGEYLEEVVGALPQRAGFDRKTGWAVDWSGAVRRVVLEDLEAQQAVMWLYSGRWLDKDTPFTFGFDAARTTAKEFALTIRIRDGELNGSIFVERETGLLRRYTRKSSAGEEVWEFADYAEALGFKLARSMKGTAGGQTNTFTITKVEPAPIFVRNPYEMPRQSHDGVTYDSGANARVEAKRAFTGHTLIKALVNGKDVGWFILDSGAGALCLDPTVANDLSMTRQGEIPVVGIGGLVLSPLRRGVTFTVGQVTLQRPVFVELDLAMIGQAFGVKLAGICGYDLLARSVLEIDASVGAVSVYGPTSAEKPGGEWVSILLDGKHPVVQARFEGDRKGWFRLDTGANNSVTFHSEWVKRLDLLKGRETRPDALGGVGGVSEARSGTIEWFELGGHRFEKPTVSFSLDEDGPLADPYTVGNIGQGFLRPFRLVFDYSNERIAFLKK